MRLQGDVDRAVVERVESVVEQQWPGTHVSGLCALAGHSGLTLRADLSGVGAPERAVLKLCPPGRAAIGRHDVVRQAVLLTELGRTSDVPIAAIIAIDTEDPPAILQAWVAGEAVEPILELAPGALPAEVVAGRFRAAARCLARLHRLDVARLATTADVVPTTPAEEVERWVPTMKSVDPSLTPGADDLYRRLMEDVPSSLTPRIVHGDYRLGNVLCVGTEVEAVVDWEIWSVGDPRVDLGWFRIMCVPDDMPGMSTPQEGVPAPDQLLADYEEEAGVPVGEMRWFDAAIRFKMAAIMGNNLKRHRSGARHDPYQERLVTAIPTLVRAGLALVG